MAGLVVRHWYHKRYSLSDTKVLLKSFPATNMSHRIIGRRKGLVQRTPCEGPGMCSLLPAGRNLRHLECWLWIFIWFTSLLGLFFWKSIVGKGLIWGLQFSLYLETVSVLESHLRDAESSSTSFAEKGLMKAAREKGWMLFLKKKGLGGLQVQQSCPEEGEIRVDGSGGICRRKSPKCRWPLMFPLTVEKLSFFSKLKTEIIHLTPHQTTLLLSKCLCLHPFSTIQFEYQTWRNVSEEKKVVSEGFAQEFHCRRTPR